MTQNEQGYFGNAFTIEPGVSYSHFSTAQLNLNGFLALDAIFLGLISIDQTNADVITTDVTARYGIGRFQADVNIPYLYRRSNFRSGGAGGNASGLIERTMTSSGIGDVSAGLSYRLLNETAALSGHGHQRPRQGADRPRPVRDGTDRGRGQRRKPQDPLTPVDRQRSVGRSGGRVGPEDHRPDGGVRKLHLFPQFQAPLPGSDEAIDDQPGEAKLGGAFQYALGVAFALNDRSSLNTSFTQRFVRHSMLRLDPTDPTEEATWQTIVGSQANVGVLNIGATFSLSDRLTLLSNLAIGITQDAPDMTFMVRLPYQF